MSDIYNDIRKKVSSDDFNNDNIPNENIPNNNNESVSFINFSIFPEDIDVNNLNKEPNEEEKKENNIENNFSQNFNSSQTNNNYSQSNIISSQQNINSYQKNLNSSEKYLNSSEISKNSENSHNSQKIEKKFYSYECTNNFNLAIYNYEETNESKIEVNIKNNGSLDWPKNTAKLIFEDNSDIKGEEVILQPQKCGEELKYEVMFKQLEKLKVGEYKSYVRFEINGETIGEKLILKNIIKEKENNDDDINNFIDKINEFRGTFNLDENDYSDERLLEVLRDNDFNEELAFGALFA